MAGECDPTVKMLVETSPSDWPVLDGRPRAPVTDISAEITEALSGAADRFLRVDGPEPYVHHLDFQSGKDSAALPPRLHLYNRVAEYRTGLPVRSVAVLMGPQANSPQLTGLRVLRLPDETRPYDVWRYGVLRVWLTPPKVFLKGGPGTLPFAPISALSEADLPTVIRQMEWRLSDEPARRELWAATRILMGLRYPTEQVDHLLRGIREMKESTTYQATLAEGRVEGEVLGRVQEARRLLLLMGEAAWGPPPPEARDAVEAMNDIGRLEQWTVATRHAPSWHEVLGLPAPKRRGRRSRF